MQLDVVSRNVSVNKEIQHNELRSLVTQLCGSFQHDDSVIAKLRASGPERLFPYLRELLDDPDVELRCRTALAIFYIDPKDGIDLLVPLLDDSEWLVRVEVRGLLHDPCRQSCRFPTHCKNDN